MHQPILICPVQLYTQERLLSEVPKQEKKCKIINYVEFIWFHEDNTLILSTFFHNLKEALFSNPSLWFTIPSVNAPNPPQYIKYNMNSYVIAYNNTNSVRGI